MNLRIAVYVVAVTTSSCMLEEPDRAEVQQGLSMPSSSTAGPSCVVDEADFEGGLVGYCVELGGGAYQLDYHDRAGAYLDTIHYQGDAEGAPMLASCVDACAAGAFEMLVEEERPGPKNRYPTCGDDGPDGGTFNCMGACGPGCKRCNPVVGEHCGGSTADDDNGCRRVDFECYTRPCCSRHDTCLAGCNLIGGWWARQACKMGCHAVAVTDGCGPNDALGLTGGKPDATPVTYRGHCVEIGEAAAEPVP